MNKAGEIPCSHGASVLLGGARQLNPGGNDVIKCIYYCVSGQMQRRLPSPTVAVSFSSQGNPSCRLECEQWLVQHPGVPILSLALFLEPAP